MKRLRFWVRLAWRDLWQSKREISLTVTALCLGFLTLMLILLFRESSQDYVERKAVATMAADVALSSRTPFEPEALEKVEAQLKIQERAEETEFLAMAQTSSGTQLSEIKAVSTNFPLAGRIQLKNSGASPQELLRGHKALVGPELLTQLKVQVGDQVQIGELRVEIGGVVLEAPGLSRFSFGAAPKIFLHKDLAKQTQLLGFGSQARYRRYYRVLNRAEILDREEALEELATEAGFSLLTPLDSVRGLDRALKSFGRYLSLVSLMMTLLFFMTGFYFLQLFVARRVSHMAVLQTFGATRRGSLTFFLVLTGLMTLMGFLLALLILSALTLGAQPWVNQLVQGDIPYRLGLNFELLGWALVVALFACLLAYLPIYVRIRLVEPRLLFEQSTPDLPQTSRDRQVWVLAAVTGGFYALSAWLLDSFLLSLAFLGFILLSLALGAWAIPRTFHRIRHYVKGASASSRLAALNLSRVRFTSLLFFLCLSQISLTGILIPNFLNVVTQELQAPQQGQRPALFLVNIEEDRLSPLQKFLQDNEAQLKYASPMILARLTAVNGQAPEEERYKRFPVRISYREGLIASERMLEGEEVTKDYQASEETLPAITMEHRYAERHGFSLGDVLSFEIQGIAVEGRITGLRSVRWSSFQPNFFIQFQPGVLNDFPKSYVAVAYQSAKSTLSSLQFDLSRHFPGLTIIDVSDTIEKIIALISQLMVPVRFVAFVALCACLILLFALIGHNIQSRQQELQLLQWIGLTQKHRSRLLVKEFVLAALLANVTGLAMGWVTTTIINRHILPSEAGFLWLESLAIVAGLSMTAGVLVSLSLWLQKRRAQ